MSGEGRGRYVGQEDCFNSRSRRLSHRTVQPFRLTTTAVTATATAVVLLSFLLFSPVPVSCVSVSGAVEARVSRTGFNDPINNWKTRNENQENDDDADSRPVAADDVVLRSRRASTGQEPELLISPIDDPFRMQKGKSSVLSCSGSIVNSDLFTDLEWYDPRGNKITHGSEVTTTLTNRKDKLQLIFAKPDKRHAGTYTCRGVYADSENLAVTRTVSIFEGISFKNCGDLQTLAIDSVDSAVTCTADSDPPADITWLKDGQTLDPKSYAIGNSGISLLNRVSEADAGNFTVMATVAETGTLQMRDIVVEVHTRPVITDIAAVIDVVEGESAELRCIAAAKPYASFGWKDANNRPLIDTNGYTVDTKTGLLKIHKVSRSADRGNFTCSASNAAGSDERVTEVRIITKPVITRFESSSTGYPEGQEISLSCSASGNPSPRLSLRREGHQQKDSNNNDDNNILTSDNERIFLSEEPGTEMNTLTLRYKLLNRTDAGNYLCEAENTAGRTSAGTYLTVKFKPDLNNTETLVKTWSRHVLNVTCNVEAIPNATIIWLYDMTGQRIPEGERYKVFPSPNGSSSHLQVTAIDSEVYTSYRCQALNNMGESGVSIKVEQAFVPGPAEGIRVIKRSPQSVTFAFTPMVEDGGLPVIRYHVKYSEVNQPGLSPIQKAFTWSVSGLRDSTEVLLLDNLKSESEYEYEFAAENPVGMGPYGNRGSVRLPKESQPDAVSINMDSWDSDPLSGDVMSRWSKEFKVRWTEPNDNGRPIESYDIKYYKVKKSESEWLPDGDVFRSSVPPSEPLLSYTLSSLSPSTHYKIEISARNALGSSHPASLIFHTAGYNDGSDEERVDHELVMDTGHLIILITVFMLAVFLFLVILDLICCFGFNTGLMRFCCGNPGSGVRADGGHRHHGEECSSGCCGGFFGSSRRSIHSGSGSSIQKEDLDEDDGGVTGGNGGTGGTNGTGGNGQLHNQYRHVSPHVANGAGDAV